MHLSRTTMLPFSTISLSLSLSASVSGQVDSSDYTDCESCVEAGWGWSWSKQACGGYLSTNCDPDSTDAYDEEEDEDFLSAAESDYAQPEEATIPFQIPEPAPLPREPLEWANTEPTTHLWQLAHAGDLQSLAAWLYREPSIVHLRSEDGRGPLFWASEYEQWEMIDFLIERGADVDATDAVGNKPADMLPAGARRPKNIRSTLNTQQAAAQAAQGGR